MRMATVYANVSINVECEDAEDAEALVRRWLDMSGPSGAPRGIDDIEIIDIELSEA